MPVFCVRRAACVLLALIAGVCQSAAQGLPPVLNPKTYASPSGEYRLEVDPSTMHGQGAGSYRLTRGGDEVWAKTLPLTLWEAAVTDDGVTVGYAYTHGLHGFPPPEERDKLSADEWNGFFHVVILDAQGELRLNNRQKRERSCIVGHDLCYPAAKGLFVDAGNDRFVIRLADLDLNRGVETWRSYRLSDGQRLGECEPAKLMPGADRSWNIYDARPVLATPLTLVHWYVVTGSDQADDGRFALVDEQGRPVWTLERRGDYVFAAKQPDRWAVRCYLQQHSAILDVREPRRFELWFPGEKTRVKFEVRPEAACESGWSVDTIGLRDYVGVELPARVEPEFEAAKLKRLGDITLRARTAEPHPIRDLMDFDFDDQGRIGFVRREEAGRCVFVLVRPTGEVVREVPLPVSNDERTWRLIASWLTGDRWVVVRSLCGDERKSSAWLLSMEPGSLAAIDQFDCYRAESVAGTRDGGFVVLATHDYGSTASDELVAFDAAGKRRWVVKEDYSNEAALFSPEGVAVTRAGVVAVIDNVANRIQLFDKGGAYLRTIDLEKAFGQEPSYPVCVAADQKDGLIVSDFEGSPPVWRLSADGKVVGKFNPKFADGRALPLHVRVRAAPDGRLWATDCESLYRLTDAGVVDLILGTQPDPEYLSGVAAFTTDSRGLFYVVSDRTGAVHVFERDGASRHVCKPLPTDFASRLVEASITVAGDGSVYVTGTGPLEGHLQFAADGRRVGVATLAEADIEGEWHFQPRGQTRWITGWQELYLVGEDGKRSRTIKRRPDGTWLEIIGDIGVASDGSAAVVCRDSERMGPYEPVVCLFGPQGEPIRTIALPFDGYVYRMAYNGRCIVLARGAYLLILDPEGKSIRKFVPEGGSEDTYWEPFFSPDGPELLLHESRSLSVQRYEAPSF